MNHCYRIVYNKHSQSCVPAPETAKNNSKSSISSRASVLNSYVFNALKLTTLSLSLAVLFSDQTLAAAPGVNELPTGGQVVAGNAAISQNNNNMQITQNSDKAIINWQSFNIGSNASVNFQQHKNSDVALNRVMAGDASQIHGKLTANGTVMLINPNGVVFGANSQVNVGGIVASTMDITDADFMQGNHKFQRGGANGAIRNQGQITAADGGTVALLAPTVQNDGIITANMGNVIMAAGDTVTLDVGANGLLKAEVQASTVQTLVENRQLVVADGGQVVMTGRAANALSESVVSNTGTIQANTLAEQNGRIVLLADMRHGEVNAAGTLQANFVETYAATVNLDKNLKVDTKGGNWLIDPTDITIDNNKASAIQNALASGNVKVTTKDGQEGNPVNGTDEGNIKVNADLAWTNNKLTLEADNEIHINAVMSVNDNATLDMIAKDDASVMVGFKDGEAQGFAGRVDFEKTGSGLLNINGNDYYVLGANDLGVENDATTTSLQGIKNNLSGYYALGADINAGSTSAWDSGAGFTPIGSNPVSSFKGVFDGLGHSIQNLTIKREQQNYVGLFGVAGNTGTRATIRNLASMNSEIIG